ncbi:GTP-binding protein, partial [Methylicorpusculum sp.]
IYGQDMLRYKGIMNIKGHESSVIYQGVHMLMNYDFGKPWAIDENRKSVMVFIGRNLPREAFFSALDECRI